MEAVSYIERDSLPFLIRTFNLIHMKIKKPDWKDIVIFIETAILFKLFFHFWDEVKAFVVSLFT